MDKIRLMALARERGEALRGEGGEWEIESKLQEIEAEAAGLLRGDLREARILEGSLYREQGTPAWDALAREWGWKDLGEWHRLASLISNALEILSPGSLERGAAAAERALARRCPPTAAE